MKLLRISIFCVLSLHIYSVQASLIDNGTYTSDIESGLDWLDVTETIGLSAREVYSQTGAGGDYEGWRFATGNEFNGLVSNYTGEVATGFDAILQVPDRIDGLIDLLGSTFATSYPTADIRGTYGLVSDIAESFPCLSPCTPRLDIFVAGLVDLGPGPDGKLIFGFEGDFSSAHIFVQDSDTGGSNSGSFLVRDSTTSELSPVPAPPSIVLLVAGLLTFMSMSRRKFSL